MIRKLLTIAEIFLRQLFGQNFVLLIGSGNLFQDRYLDRTRFAGSMNRFVPACTLKYTSSAFSLSWIFKYLKPKNHTVFIDPVLQIMPVDVIDQIIDGWKSGTKWNKNKLFFELRQKVKTIINELQSLNASAISCGSTMFTYIIGPDKVRTSIEVYGWENDVRNLVKMRAETEKRTDELMDQLVDIVADEMKKGFEGTVYEFIDMRGVGSTIQNLMNYDQLAAKAYGSMKV